MNKEGLEIIKIQNISSYDFPFVDTKSLNRDYRRSRNANDLDSDDVNDDSRYYRRPDMPTLMFDGDTYALRAGEVKEFPRMLAERFAEKIVDRVIIEGGKVNLVRDKRVREKYMAEVMMKTVIPVVQEEVEQEEAEVVEATIEQVATAEMGMPQLRSLAKGLDITVPVGTSKVQLAKIINEKTAVAPRVNGNRGI